MLRWPVISVIVGLIWAVADVSFAAELLCTASALETYVGAPVRIQVIIKDVRVYEPPAFPEVDGADVRELREEGQEYPSVRRAEGGEGNTIVYTYAVTPRRAGTIVFPPIRVRADGGLFSTSPMQIVAKESEPGDLLYLELLGDRDEVYLGEPVNATLEIWLKPYGSKNVRMDPEDMWRYAIDEDASIWGAFRTNLQDDPRSITYRTETRADASGASKPYFVFSLSREVWPERAGVFDAGGVKVVVDYPLKMRRKRASQLGRPYEIVESRPILADVKDSKILVKVPPMEGQPDTFRGAVGRFTMTATATPTEVTVGDPITLNLEIGGAGRLDLLRSPLLADQGLLAADFRVPDEQLAGIVDNGSKKFSQTIRAKHGDVTSIPPIRFSYFDPETERYVTLSTNPIPLKVKESTWLAVSGIVGGGSFGNGRIELTAVETGLLANYDDLQALLAPQSLSFGWGSWSMIGAGPVLYLICLLSRRHRDRLAGDVDLERRRSARRTAMTAIRRAIIGARGSDAASWAATAVTRYVADRCALPRGGVTRNEVIGQLRARNLPEATINEVDKLLAECEMTQYAGRERRNVGGLIKRARNCVNELERRNL